MRWPYGENARQNDFKLDSKLAIWRFSCLPQSQKHPFTYLARAISTLFLFSPLYHDQKSRHTEILRTPDRTPIKEFQEVITRWTLPSNHLLSLSSSYHGQELYGKETVEQRGPSIPEMLSVTCPMKKQCADSECKPLKKRMPGFSWADSEGLGVMPVLREAPETKPIPSYCWPLVLVTWIGPWDCLTS